MIETLGILGVGHLASYVVAGLRHGGYNGSILLSPRNPERSAALAKQHGCELAATNEELLRRSEYILLAVRPAQAEGLLQSLTFSTEQLVISCVAGMPLAELERLVAPARVVRTLPLACAEIGEGAVPLYPDHPQVRELLGVIGQVICLKNEAEFELASVAACMNGWMYGFFEQLTHWYVDQGMAPAEARALVLHSVGGAAKFASARPELPLRGISDSIATPGTYTLTGLELLQNSDAFSPWLQACEQVSLALKK
ncbi:MAG: pyrroline-5-carboxylate reductase [Motiliproteus sp.]|jgi:pyrroline-5-carboxylate reductase